MDGKTKWKSSTLNYYDSPDHCLICRFIDGDRSEEVMLAVINQLDHSLSKKENIRGLLKASGLLEKIAELKEELSKRPKLVCVDADDQSDPFDVKSFPNRIRAARVYRIDIETEDGHYIFHSTMSTATPEAEIEFVVHENLGGEVGIVAVAEKSWDEGPTAPPIEDVDAAIHYLDEEDS